MSASVTASEDGLVSIWLETRTSRAIGYACALHHGLLVDSGFAHARHSLLRALAGRRLDQVVNTHVHEDHAGNNAVLAREFGATVLAPAGGLHLLADPTRLNFRFYEHLIWGRPEPFPAAKPLGASVATSRGRLEVVPTPGHSPEHVAFFEPERRWLFTGDLFLGCKVRAARPYENMADLADSLRRVLALSPRRLFCTHRGVIDAPVPALETKLRFVEELRAQVTAMNQAGLPVRAMAARALGAENALVWLLTGGDYSRAHLVRACLRPPGSGYRQPGSVEY